MADEVKKVEPVAAAPTATTTVSTSEKVAWMEPPKEGAPAPAAPTAKIPADAVKPAPAADPAKPAAEPAAAKAPATEIDLKLPEGVTLEPAALEGYKNLAKELGLTSEQAQKFVARDLAQQKASRDALMTQLDGIDKSNLAKLKDRWGEKFPEMSEKVKRVFDYADPKGNLRKEVEAMKMAHAPELIEFVERFVPLFEDPSLKAPSAAGVTEKDTRPAFEQLQDRYRKAMASPGTPIH